MTGGAGYIGSHAAKALRQAGYRVVIYDNLSAGHREAALGAPLVEGDIRDVDAVRRALKDSGASAVMHFAAWLTVSDSVHDPVGYYRNNVMGTLATLEDTTAGGTLATGGLSGWTSWRIVGEFGSRPGTSRARVA